MPKYCYVCGREIKAKDFYYNIGPNSYVCENDDCFIFYFWDSLAARMAVDKKHEYAIIGRNVYQIGNDDDEPKGFSGRHRIIQFNDGVQIETNSLWHRGELPIRLQNDFKDNAKFITY